MTISNEMLTAVVGFIGTFVSVIVMIARQSKKMGVLEFKVETMWQAQLRRGMAEAVSQNHGTMNSPFTANPEAAVLYGPLLDEMKTFMVARITKPIRDSDAIMLLEHEFGERVAQAVCVPSGMNQLGCMVVALSLIREGSVEIEGGQTFITDAVIRDLVKQKKAGALVLAVSIPVPVAPVSDVVASALTKLATESQVQTEKIAVVAEEVHDLHEDSEVRKRESGILGGLKRENQADHGGDVHG